MSDTTRGLVADAAASPLAPALVCRVASWIVRLRKLADADPDLNAKIGYLLGPLPFERELLSGRMDEVERALSGEGSSMVGGDKASDPGPSPASRPVRDEGTASAALSAAEARLRDEADYLEHIARGLSGQTQEDIRGSAARLRAALTEGERDG